MDADCLIKLTKARLKELVCQNFTVVIPQLVEEEVVDNASAHPDSVIIRQNLDKKLLSIEKHTVSNVKGENAVYEIFQRGKFEAVCSDDKKFIKRLRFFDIPYITPSVFIVLLVKAGRLTIKEAFETLERLASFVSDDEYHAVRVVLESRR